MEGNRISFGFKKTKKADKPVAVNNDERKEYIECVEEQSIKVVGGEIIETKEPLVIPMKPNSLVTTERMIEIALKVEGGLEEPEIKTETVTIKMEDPLEENLTLDQMAERELMQEAKKEVITVTPTMEIPTSTKSVVGGEKEKAKALMKDTVVLLLDLISKQTVILTKGTDATTNKLKEDAWKKVAEEFCSLTGEIRRPDQLRLKWENLKKAARKRCAIIKQNNFKSTLDDYEAIPVKDFGVAMLRGMGWTPGKEGTERSSQPSQEQINILLNFLEKNPRMAKGLPKSTSEKMKAQKNWEVVTSALNSRKGSNKTWKQWTKYWKDKKSAIKRKVIKNKVCDPSELVELTELEHRIYSVSNVDMHPVMQSCQPELLDIQQEHLTNTIMETEPELHRDTEHETCRNATKSSPAIEMNSLDNLAASTSSQRTVNHFFVPSVNGVHPPKRLPTKSRLGSNIESRSRQSLPSPVRGSSIRRRPGPISSTISQIKRHTHSLNIAERFLEIEERRLENERRTTTLLETVVNNNAENNRLMSEALLSIGEGLKLLAEAVKNK